MRAVNFPTHELGNTLDLIMHPIDSYLVHSIRAGPLFSDHFALLFQISVNKPKRPTIYRSTRHLHHISISQFSTDLNMLPTHDAQSLHNSLILTLDTHAYVFNKTTILRPNTSWYTTDLYRQKRCLRMLESKWKKEKSSSSLTTYKDLKNKHRIDLINAKAMFTHDKFISMQHDSKSLFKLANSILGRRQKSPYPDFTNDELPNLFDSFFNDKITNIISSLPKPISIAPSFSTTNTLTSFFLPSNDQLICLLKNSRSSSSLDPIPLKLLNDIAPYIISNIAHIIHESLISGTVPLIFKHSLITPIIKKPSIDPSSFNNYIPISNLSILSKTLERVVSKQLSSFLTTNNILCTFQSTEQIY